MTASPPLLASPERIRSFRSKLLSFFDEVRRDLPWRENVDAYGVHVSEVMLQQTRVETVIPYFRRWMARFPTREALAEAGEEEVLKEWEGLGYYSRARNLHQAVTKVVRERGGSYPRTPDELRRLPGVGPYTAGAVASIAFGVAAPAVDGNVTRVLARLMDAPAPSPGELRGWAQALVDPDRPGDFNQAVMELGALVCTPRDPACATCPVAAFCRARVAGTQKERPTRRARSPAPWVCEAVAVVEREGEGGAEYLFRRRPNEGLLAGMWEFPGAEAEAAGAGKVALAVARRVANVPSPEIHLGKGVPLPPVDHAFSHLRVRYLPHRFRLRGREASTEAAGGGVCWRSAARARAELPLPVAQRAILDEVAAFGSGKGVG